MSDPRLTDRPAPWRQLSFRLPLALEDAALTWLQGETSLGAETRRHDDGSVSFSVYFPSTASRLPLQEAVARLQEAVRQPVETHIASVVDGDWAEAYQRSLQPFRVGRFTVFPGEALPVVEGGQIPLWIPPGRAFGTGDHPTTTLCLEYLERHVSGKRRVLDVGTGTGILAIAAARLGAPRVVALELDPEAADVARQNLQRNKVADRVELLVGTTAAISGGWFDLAAANLRSGILVECMPHLAYLLRPGGGAVLSGVLLGEEEVVEAAAVRRGLRPGERRVRGEWVALQVHKPA